MKMLLHLMRKDLRATRLWLVVISTFAAALIVLPQHGLIKEDLSWHEFSILLGWLGWLAVVLFQRSLLNLDPPQGAERFIGTKPTSGGQVIVSKICLIFTMGVLPVTAAATWRLIHLDAGVTWAEALTVSAENATLLILLLGLLALPTALPFHSAWITGISVILAATLMMFSVIIVTLLSAPPTWFWYLIPIICLSLAGVSGVVTHSLRLRGIHRLLLSLLVGLIGTSGIAAMLHEKKSSRFEGTPFEQPLKIVSATNGGLSAYLHSGLPGNVVEIRQNCRLQGLPKGVFAEHWRVTGQIPDLPKMVWIGAPHTTNWDGVLGLATLLALGVDASTMIKDSAFMSRFRRSDEKRRFCVCLAALIHAGVSLDQAIEISCLAAGRPALEPDLPYKETIVERLTRAKILSQEELGLLTVAELSGTVDTALAHIAESARL